MSHQHLDHGTRDVGPRLGLAALAVGGIVAIGLGATPFGVILVLLGVTGGIASGVGPLLTRRADRLDDIVVPRWTGADASALAAEQRRLTAHLSDADQVRTVVRPRVAALVEERLVRRGVDPRSAQAGALLSEPLASFLAGSARGGMSPAAFAAVLAGVEAL